jgi:PKD repeat protein
MKKLKVIPLALFSIIVLAFLVAPVVAAGLTATDCAKISTTEGSASTVITLTDSDINQDGTITIDLTNINYFVSSYTLMNENILINDTAAAATWTYDVAGATLTLTSTGGLTAVGETITVTFAGTSGNPWVSDTMGEQIWPVTATRTDGLGDVTFNFVIETAPPPPNGLSVTSGSKITSTDGATSPVITITESGIAPNGTITIGVADLHHIVASSIFTDANVRITDTAGNAIWTRSVTGDTLTLTSTEGPTVVGETIIVNFTGAANPWIHDTVSEWTYPLTASRTDGLGYGYFNFVIETTPPPPINLIIQNGTKITSTNGATSPVITITGTDIAPDQTIFIDVSTLNAFVASGTLSDSNVIINDTAVNATWTRSVTSGTLMLTSSEGLTAVGETITVTFTGAGGNPWIPDTHGERTELLNATRTDGAGSGSFNFVIETAPPSGFTVAANFTASTTSDMPPLSVAFTDTSTGSPASWSWDFGDGATSANRNPVHTYNDIGSYTVNLTVTNPYGSDTISRWHYIRVLNGGIREANTAIAGLKIANCASRQTITVDTSILPAALIPNNSVLELQPPADSGFKNITIYSMNGIGFSRYGNLIVGKPTSVHMISEDIAPPSGFSDNIGTNSSFNYSMDLTSYPCYAKLSTKIWEGEVDRYDALFDWVASNNSAFPVGTAYTAKITKTNVPSNARLKLRMSVSSAWNPSIFGERVLIWRIADDEKSGQILPTTYLYSDPENNLDVYEADSPSGMSVYGLSSLTGNNNPFQMISFVAAQAINSATGGGAGASKAVVAETTSAPVIKSTLAPDAGKTAKIYANADGVISQQTILASNDGFANVSLGLGVVAKDGSGKPLTSISITRIADENLPAGSPGADLSFAGMAYEIQPDGVTFSPPVPVAFTIPQAKWGREYVMQEYDHTTGTWKALESSYDPSTSVITTHISHLCCFALFAKTPVVENTMNPTPTTTIIISSKSSMETNVQLYTWVISLIRQNPVIIVILVALIGVVAYFGWWKRRL